MVKAEDRLARYKTYDSPEGMDPKYRETLVGLMKRMIWAEMAATTMYSQALHVATNWRDRCAAADLSVEESRHVRGVGDILVDHFGVDLEAHFRSRPNSYDGNFPALMGVEDSPLEPGERFPPNWTAAAVALFIADRAAVFQLAQYEDNSYRPWAVVMDMVLEDEAGEGGHMDIGEATIRKLCQDPGQKKIAQDWVDAFLPASTRLLGRPGNPLDEYCLEVGLKRKTSAECQREFFESLIPIVEDTGLTMPDLQAAGVALVDPVIAMLAKSPAYAHELKRSAAAP